MGYCIVFQEDVSGLTSTQINQRCKNCLENTGGPDGCKWMQTFEEIGEDTSKAVVIKKEEKENE